MSIHAHNPTFENPEWEKSAFRALILRLSSFRDVQRSTPHLFLAREARRGAPDSYIDMAFLPDLRERTELDDRGLPLILGIQSARPLRDFDIALVSNSCVPELSNLPYLLSGSDIPLWAGERGEDIPAILLGGSNSAAANAIVREDGDCMADALFFGEGEGAVELIVGFWRSSMGMPKRERLAALADRIQGIWPWGDLSRKTARAVRSDSPPYSSEDLYPILPGEEATTARLEITLGCPCLCSFCFEGHDRKPFRELPVAHLLAEARKLKAAGGARVLEIASYNFNTHEGIVDLLLECNRIFLRVNAMSQRIDILGRDPGLLEAEIAAGKRSFTLGVEGVSERQRKLLHKSLDMRDIRGALERLHRPKVRELKLFFLLTGGEEEQDFVELTALIRFLKELRKIREKSPRVIFSFGLLVRMPFTPLRYDGLLLSERRWRPLIGKAKSLCQTNGFEFRLSSAWTDYLLTQLIALGGPRLHSLITRLAKAGMAYDREYPPEAGAIAEAWMAENPAHVGELAREKPPDYRFPLWFIETPEERAFLYSQFEKAMAFIDEGYCRRGEPRGCGECLSCTRKKAGARRAPVASAAIRLRTQEISDLVDRKARLHPIYVDVGIPSAAASSSREWRAACLMREFLSRFPRQVDNVLSMEEILVGGWMGDGCRCAWHGRGVTEVIAWDTASVANDLSAAAWPDGGTFFSPSPLPIAGKPASFDSIDLSITFGNEQTLEAETVFLEALRAQHARFTVMRDGNAHKLVVSDQTARKKIIFGGGYGQTPQGSFLRVRAGWKLDARALFSGLTGAHVEILALELG